MADPVFTQTSIQEILIEAVSARLVKKLITDIDPTDSALAKLIRPGKLQDDPTTKKINILVSPGGEEWKDILNEHPQGLEDAWEIGSPYGATAYKRRFIVDLQLFYSNETRGNARKKTHLVMARANHALSTQHFAGLGPDSFGESAYRCIVCHQHVLEGGGDGDFNWRGKLHIEYWTNIVFTELD